MKENIQNHKSETLKRGNHKFLRLPEILDYANRVTRSSNEKQSKWMIVESDNSGIRRIIIFVERTYTFDSEDIFHCMNDAEVSINNEPHLSWNRLHPSNKH